MRWLATDRLFGAGAAVALGVFIVTCGPRAAAESPEPAPSPSPSPTATPASASLVSWARDWRSSAVRQRRRLARVRRCFVRSGPVKLASSPLRSASAEEWRKAGRRWRYQSRDWRAKARDGRVKMRRPGGSGAARWMPLARWVGWPEWTLPTLQLVIWRESSGRPRAVNPSSGCAGLVQIHPCHGVSNPLDPEVNLRAGLRLWRSGGWRHWVWL